MTEWLVGFPDLRFTTVHRIANGKIVEDWVLVESLGFFQQLGAVPATQEIIARAMSARA